MYTILNDLKYSLRNIFRNPMHSIAIVALLSIGVAAITFVLTIYDSFYKQALPIYNPQNIVMFKTINPVFPGTLLGRIDSAYSYPMYLQLNTIDNVFEGLICRKNMTVILRGENGIATVSGEYVSGNYFEVLGIPTTLGRVINKNDEQNNDIAVISYKFWQRYFKSDPSVLGKVVYFDGSPLAIVGVTDKSFYGIEKGVAPDVYVPVTLGYSNSKNTPKQRILTNNRYYWIQILGRLKNNTTLRQANEIVDQIYKRSLQDEVQAMGPDANRQAWDSYTNQAVILQSIPAGVDSIQKNGENDVIFIICAAAVLFIIVCTNITSLQISKIIEKINEIEIRLALGARISNIITITMFNNILLAIMASFMGTSIVFLLIKPIENAVSAFAQIEGQLHINYRVMLATMIILMLWIVLYSILVAVQLLRRSKMSSGNNSGIGIKQQLSLKNTLVVLQIILSVTLLTIMYLFVNSFINLHTIDTGYRDDILVVQINTKNESFTKERINHLQEQISEKIKTLTGIDEIGLATSGIMYSGNNSSATIEDTITLPLVGWNGISHGFFKNMGIPLLAGREFLPSDNENTEKVAIINKTFLKSISKDENIEGIIGSRIALPAYNSQQIVKIVGIVPDAVYGNTYTTNKDYIFLCMNQYEIDSFALHIKYNSMTQIKSNEILPTILTIDPQLEVWEIQTLSQFLKREMAPGKLMVIILVIMAIIATILTASGISALLLRTLAHRKKEIGIRIALGAGNMDIAILFLKKVFYLACIGIIIGEFLIVFTANYVMGTLYNIAKLSFWNVLIPIIVLLLAISIASISPIYRAIKIDPMESIKSN